MRTFQSNTSLFWDWRVHHETAKPFFRKFARPWYVQIGNWQINLGSDRKLAWEKYHQLMASHVAVTEQLVTVAQLFDTYLE